MTQHIGRKAQQLIEASNERRSIGRLAEAVAALTDAVRGPGAEDLTTFDRAAILRDLAELRLAQGEWDLAHEHLDDALVLLGGGEGKRDHPAIWAAVMERKAFAHFRQGHLAEARAAAHLASEEAARETESRTLAAVHNTLAGIAWEESRLDEALEHVAHAAELFEAAGDDIGAAIAATNRGIILFSRGRWQETEQKFVEADAILAKKGGPQSDRARTLANRGVLELAQGRHAEARRDLADALDAARHAQANYVAARAHIAIAHLDLLESSYDEANGHLQAVNAMDCLTDDDRVQAAALTALLECDRNAVERGLEIAGRAREIARNAHLLESEADCCRALAVAHRRSRRIGEAEALLLESIALAEQAGDPYRRALALLDLAAVRHEAANRDRARQHVDEAATLFQQLGARFDLSRAESLRQAMA